MYFARPEFTTPVFVATVAGGQSGRVYPLAPVYRSHQLKYLRVNLFLEALSPGDNKLTVEVGLQVSDDGVTWDTSVTACHGLRGRVLEPYQAVRAPRAVGEELYGRDGVCLVPRLDPGGAEDLLIA